jgi:hypothetical protein
VSPRTRIPDHKGPEDPITLALLDDPAVIHDVDGETLVLALKDQLLVRRAAHSPASYNNCPAGPPIPSPAPHDEDEFVLDLEEPRVNVVVIDTGYIRNQGHVVLDNRVNDGVGYFWDAAGVRQVCKQDFVPPPGVELSEVTGHGTFIAGIVAHKCPHAQILAVCERRAVQQLPVDPNSLEQGALYADEFSVANAMLRYYQEATVISCGFAFPTLDEYPSSAFTSVMQVINPPDEPDPRVVVVSPAGNESSYREYWPAAHADVVGVAATNRMDNGRALFSNWGDWVDCCTRGQDVHSTYIRDWSGMVQGEPGGPQRFAGWARWDGTSFAGPKVAAAIACEVERSGGSPRVEYENLVARAVAAHDTLTDPAFAPGYPVPHLKLG